MQRHRVAVVINTRAGHVRRDPGVVHRVTEAVGRGATIIAAGTIEDLDRGLARARDEGADVVGIVGGDGTVGVTVTAVARVWGDRPLPTVAFLRGGTMNTVANSVGVPRGRPEALARRLRGAVESGRLRSAPRGTVRARERLGFLFGTGVVQGYLREYYAAGEPSPVTAARVLARGVASAATGGAMISRMARPIRASVDFGEGLRWSTRDWLTVAGGTIDQIGLGFRPFHRANERDDVFHLLGIHCSAFDFAVDLPRVWRASGLRDGKSLDHLTALATLTADAPSLPYMLDGDLLEGPPSLTLSAGPALRLAVLDTPWGRF